MLLFSFVPICDTNWRLPDDASTEAVQEYLFGIVYYCLYASSDECVTEIIERAGVRTSKGAVNGWDDMEWLGMMVLRPNLTFILKYCFNSTILVYLYIPSYPNPFVCFVKMNVVLFEKRSPQD